MKNYANYVVPFLSNFTEALQYAKENYSNCVLFQGYNFSYTYVQFIQEVDTLVNYFNHYDDELFVLDIGKSSIHYLSCLFAIVISNNRVVLEKKEDFTCFCCKRIIDKKFVDEILSNGMHINVYYKSRSQQKPNIIAFSSGTTLSAKGIMLDDYKITCNALSGMQKYKFDKDVLVHVIPYTHMFGLVCDFIGPFLSGGTICFPASTFDFVDSLKYFNPTMLNIPPVLSKVLLNRILASKSVNTVAGTQLGKILCGGAGIDESIQLKYDELGIKLFSCYGLTECSPCVSVNRDDYYRFGSAGVLLDCNQLQSTQDGEVLICGNNVAWGYIYPDGKEMLFEGLYHTGDLGYIDKDGFLYIYGRKDNLIVLGNGFKVQPEEYESRLERIYGVKEALIVYNKSTDQLLCYYVKNKEVEMSSLYKVFEGLPLQRMYECKIIEKNEMGKKIRRQFNE